MGQRLREARLRCKLTQTAVDVHLGKAPDANFVSALENGRGGSPQLSVLSALVALYGVTLDWAVNGTEGGNIAPRRTNGELLGRITDVIAKVYREEGVALPDLDLGRLAAEDYDAAHEASPDEWQGILRFIAARRRQDLRTESMGRREASG